MGLPHFCLQEKRAEGKINKPFLCSDQKIDPIHQVVTRQRDRLYSQVARTMSSKQCIQNKSFYEKNSLYVKSDSLKSSSPTDVGSGERSHSQLRDRDFTTRRLTDTTMMSEVINIFSNITLINSFILCNCIISLTYQICDIFSRWWRTGTRWRWRLSTETLQRPFSKSVSSAPLETMFYQ